MADIIYRSFGNEYDPDIAAQYPICRVFEYEGFQVAVVRDTNFDGAPMLTVSFPCRYSICSARVPFKPTAEGFEQRDSTYCAVIGHERIPPSLIATIRTVWEDKGRPGDGMLGNGHAV